MLSLLLPAKSNSSEAFQIEASKSLLQAQLQNMEAQNEAPTPAVKAIEASILMWATHPNPRLCPCARHRRRPSPPPPPRPAPPCPFAHLYAAVTSLLLLLPFASTCWHPLELLAGGAHGERQVRLVDLPTNRDVKFWKWKYPLVE